MSRTSKHHSNSLKTRMPKVEKGTKTTIRAKLLKDLEDDYDFNLDFMEI